MGEKSFKAWLAQQPPADGPSIPYGGEEDFDGDPQPNALQSFLLKGSNALNFGLQDEYDAANQALWDKILGSGGEGQSFGDRYNERLGQGRAALDYAQEQHPGASLLGGIAGAAIPTAVTGGAVGAPSVGGAAMRGAVSSGLQSLMQGFGEGEGSFINRVKNAAVNGALGAVFGGIFGWGGAALTKNKAVVKQSTVQKAVSDLTDIRRTAYADAANAGVVYDGTTVIPRITQAMNEVRNNHGYWAPGLDNKAKFLDGYMDDMLKQLQSQTTTGGLKPRDLPLDELEALRKQIKATMQTQKDFRMMDLVRGIDDIIDTNAAGNEAIRAARDASRVERNTELFDKLVKQADLRTDASGSSKIAAFKNVAVKMLTDKKTAPFLDNEETELLTSIVKAGSGSKLAQFLGRYDPTSSHFATIASALWVMNHPIVGLAASGAGYAARKMGEEGTEAALSAARNVISGSNLIPPNLTAGQGPLARGLAVEGAQQMSPLMEGMLQSNLMGSLFNPLLFNKEQGQQQLPEWNGQ